MVLKRLAQVGRGVWDCSSYLRSLKCKPTNGVCLSRSLFFPLWAPQADASISIPRITHRTQLQAVHPSQAQSLTEDSYAFLIFFRGGIVESLSESVFGGTNAPPAACPSNMFDPDPFFSSECEG